MALYSRSFAAFNSFDALQSSMLKVYIDNRKNIGQQKFEWWFTAIHFLVQ